MHFWLEFIDIKEFHDIRSANTNALLTRIYRYHRISWHKVCKYKMYFCLEFIDILTKYKRTITQSLWHRQYSTTMDVHGHLETRGGTTCPGGVSVSCLASRNRREYPRHSLSVCCFKRLELALLQMVHKLIKCVSNTFGRDWLPLFTCKNLFIKHLYIYPSNVVF